MIQDALTESRISEAVTERISHGFVVIESRFSYVVRGFVIAVAEIYALFILNKETARERSIALIHIRIRRYFGFYVKIGIVIIFGVCKVRKYGIGSEIGRPYTGGSAGRINRAGKYFSD